MAVSCVCLFSSIQHNKSENIFNDGRSVERNESFSNVDKFIEQNACEETLLKCRFESKSIERID